MGNGGSKVVWEGNENVLFKGGYSPSEGLLEGLSSCGGNRPKPGGKKKGKRILNELVGAAIQYLGFGPLERKLVLVKRGDWKKRKREKITKAGKEAPFVPEGRFKGHTGEHTADPGGGEGKKEAHREKLI